MPSSSKGWGRVTLAPFHQDIVSLRSNSSHHKHRRRQVTPASTGFRNREVLPRRITSIHPVFLTFRVSPFRHLNNNLPSSSNLPREDEDPGRRLLSSNRRSSSSTRLHNPKCPRVPLALQPVLLQAHHLEQRRVHLAISHPCPLALLAQECIGSLILSSPVNNQRRDLAVLARSIHRPRLPGQEPECLLDP